MWVKICGLQDPAVGAELAAMGLDALGINRCPESRRFVPAGRVRGLVEAVRSAPDPPEVVGVYVNEPAEALLEDALRHGFDRVQMHGDETPAEVRRVGEEISLIKALRVDEAFSDARLDEYDCGAYLVDAHVPGRYGGTGRRAPWDRVAPLTDRYRIVLAGGLTPGNVRRAVRTVQPWGVDVCSGVENEEGLREPRRVRDFLEALGDLRGSSTDRGRAGAREDGP